MALGVLWSVLAATGWALVAVEPSGGGEDLAGGLILVAWLGGVFTSFVIYRGYDRHVDRLMCERAPWPKPTTRSQRWSVQYALLAYVFTFAGAGILASVLYFGLGVHMHVGTYVLMVDAVLLCSLLPLRRRHGLSRDDLGVRAVPAVRSIGLVALALIVYVVVIVLWLIVVEPPAGTDALANVRHEGRVYVVLAIIAAAVSAPIVEEVFFRGLLYRSLRNRLSVLPAALLAGALFGLVHIASYPLETLPVKAAFGVIACLLYERTGSLLPGIGLHSLVDASGIDLALTGNDLIVFAGFSLLVVVLLIRVFVRRLLEGKRRPRLAELPQANQ
jgi:membrane protease YdiL (CAAX protease family)